MIVVSHLKRFLGSIILVAGFFYGALAQATIQINPVSVSLSQQKRTATVTVKNGSDDTILLKLETVTWSQKEGKDVYTPTKDLLVTPPVSKLAPGQTQTLRVGLLGAPNPERESTYRLYINTFPQKHAKNEADAGGLAIKFNVRFSLPVRVAAAKKAPAS